MVVALDALSRVSPSLPMASKRDEIYAIGRHFTDHYYKVFNREPQELHKLYGQTATLTSGWEGNEKDETFFGLEVPSHALSFILIFPSLIDFIQGN